MINKITITIEFDKDIINQNNFISCTNLKVSTPNDTDLYLGFDTVFSHFIDNKTMVFEIFELYDVLGNDIDSLYEDYNDNPNTNLQISKVKSADFYIESKERINISKIKDIKIDYKNYFIDGYGTILISNPEAEVKIEYNAEE